MYVGRKRAVGKGWCVSIQCHPPSFFFFIMREGRGLILLMAKSLQRGHHLHSHNGYSIYKSNILIYLRTPAERKCSGVV